MTKGLHIAFFALTLGKLWAQDRSVTVSVDREAILIGEHMNIEIKLRSHAADTVVFPAIGDTLITEIEVLKKSKLDTTYDENNIEQRTIKQTISLTSFDSGYYAIAPLLALINADTIESNPFLIVVNTVAVDTSKGIYDIRGVAQAEFSLIEWLKENWPWLALAAICIAAIIALVLWLSKRKPQPKIEIQVPKKPAHEIALEKLDALEQAKLWQAGKTKEYYSELTEILREYMEHRFAFPAMEQTSDEIVHALKRTAELNIEQVDKLKRLLFLADLVKFAKEKPVGSENEFHMTAVRSFISETALTEKSITIPTESKEDEHIG